MGDFTFIQKIRNKIRVEKGNSLFIDKRTNFVGCSVRIKGQNNRLTISQNTHLRGVNIEIIGNDCSISIGEGTIIGHNSYISTKEQGISLSIGKNCMLSRNAKVMTSDGHPIFCEQIRVNKAKSITIKDNVWIADNVTILKGLTIGENSVIGINSTVTHDIKSSVVAAGNPCRIIKEGNIRWEK